MSEYCVQTLPPTESIFMGLSRNKLRKNEICYLATTFKPIFYSARYGLALKPNPVTHDLNIFACGFV